MFSNPVGLEHDQPLPSLTTAVSSYYRIYYGTPKGTPPLARHSVFVSQICGHIRISIASPQKNFQTETEDLHCCLYNFECPCEFLSFNYERIIRSSTCKSG